MRQTRTRVLILMCLAMVLGYMPWYSFSAVAKYLVQEFNLGAGQMGAILSSFQVGYVLVVIFTGWLADRVGPRKVVAWATLFAAFSSTAFLFFARDFTSILVLRLLVGLSCGAIYAPGMSFLSSWFPSNQRGKAIGAYTAALTAAYAGGYLVASPLAASYGWRIGMLGTSIPVFIAAVIVFFLVQDRPPDVEQDIQPGSQAKPATTINPAHYGGTRRTLITAQILISVAYMGHMWELYAFWGWIGPYLVANLLQTGYAEAQAVSVGGILSALVIFAGVPAVWALGAFSDRIGRTKAIIIASLCSLVVECFFGFLFGRGLHLLVPVGLWLGFWVIADSGIYKAGLTELVSADRRSLALGMQSAAGFSLTIISPMVFGRLLEAANGAGIDATTATNWELPFLVLGLGALLAPISALILRRLPEAKLLAREGRERSEIMQD
ncbi:MAG: MFS transporter [Dehalococcoidia bacterium]|nr:MFS transporter [Dehalococcoidia bacterium]